MEQFSRKLDKKNDVLCKFMDSDIFKKNCKKVQDERQMFQKTGLSDCHKLIHSLRLTLRNFLRKILNIGITKTLTKIIFFTNLTKNSAKGLSIRKNIID